jgi:ABC-type glycerol-3-phosphate transport system substrate-binding protein
LRLRTGISQVLLGQKTAQEALDDVAKQWGSAASSWPA